MTDVHSSSNNLAFLSKHFHDNDDKERTNQKTESTELNMPTGFESLLYTPDLSKARTKDRPQDTDKLKYQSICHAESFANRKSATLPRPPKTKIIMNNKEAEDLVSWCRQ